MTVLDAPWQFRTLVSSQRRLLSALAATVLLLGLGTLAPSSASATTTTSCVGAPVPSGMVVVGTHTSDQCLPNAGYPNTHQLAFPSDNLQVCLIPSSNPVPYGYVVTSSLVAASCISNSGSPNAHIIVRPYPGVVSCLIPTYIGVPSGFATQQFITTGQCISNAGYSNARILRAA